MTPEISQQADASKPILAEDVLEISVVKTVSAELSLIKYMEDLAKKAESLKIVTALLKQNKDGSVEDLSKRKKKKKAAKKLSVKSKTIKKPLKKMYGAISLSPKTHKWRVRWNVADRQRAIGLVLTECGEPDCRVILVFGPRVCGNFSLGSKNAVGVGSARTRKEATEAALAGCIAVGSNCKAAKPRCNR